MVDVAGELACGYDEVGDVPEVLAWNFAGFIQRDSVFDGERHHLVLFALDRLAGEHCISGSQTALNKFLRGDAAIRFLRRDNFPENSPGIFRKNKISHKKAQETQKGFVN